MQEESERMSNSRVCSILASLTPVFGKSPIMHAPLIAFAMALAATSSFALGFGDPAADTAGPVAVAPALTIPSQKSGSDVAKGIREGFANEMYANGAAKQRIGRIMSWGGLAASTVGGLARQPNLAGIGSLVMLVGIPINGSGAGDMVDAMNIIHPELHLEMNGWAPYYTGWGMIGVGTAVYLNGLSDAAHSLTTKGELGPGFATMMIGSGLMEVGIVLQAVSWYKFSASADRAEMAMKILPPVSLDLQPTFLTRRDGKPAPGMNLALTF
jgi:hypothetical protein